MVLAIDVLIALLNESLHSSTSALTPQMLKKLVDKKYLKRKTCRKDANSAIYALFFDFTENIPNNRLTSIGSNNLQESVLCGLCLKKIKYSVKNPKLVQHFKNIHDIQLCQSLMMSQEEKGGEEDIITDHVSSYYLLFIYIFPFELVCKE